MELIINTRGACLKKISERFLICVGNEKNEIAATQVEKILITTSVLITTDAMKLAVENNIDLVILEESGKPFARVWHSKLGSITSIRRKQLYLDKEKQGKNIVFGVINKKLDNQVALLKKLRLNRSDKNIELIDNAINKINEYKEKLNALEGENINELRGKIEGYEGVSAKAYFNVLGKIIPNKFSFEGRSRNPASDEFNCMLNYAYGVLYSKVESACIIAGLDPYIGIMHTDNYNKKAFVFDLIEMYRGYVDEVVFYLFSKRLIKKSMFDELEGGGFYLNKEGKVLLIEMLNKKFEEVVIYNKRKVKINTLMRIDCHSIANFLLKEVN